jgi:hypothetical protein
MDNHRVPPAGTFHDATAHDAAIWPSQPAAPLARGRTARDPLAKTVHYSVSSIDELEASVREHLSSPPEQPEHTEVQLSFWIGTSFMVYETAPSNAPQPRPLPQAHVAQQQQQQQQHASAPTGYPQADDAEQYSAPPQMYHSVVDPALTLTQPHYTPPGPGAGGKKKTAPRFSLSIMEALQPTPEPKEKMRKQRAIAKCCVDAIQRVDGYRYSFHNCWNSREDDSFRFSYYCNDSLLNKDRAANGKGAKFGKRATKPVYDCKGVLSIKFSATKQTLDVIYKHVPIHKTYEERAPAPRRDSKRRKYLEVNDPDALARYDVRRAYRGTRLTVTGSPSSRKWAAVRTGKIRRGPGRRRRPSQTPRGR